MDSDIVSHHIFHCWPKSVLIFVVLSSNRDLESGKYNNNSEDILDFNEMRFARKETEGKEGRLGIDVSNQMVNGPSHHYSNLSNRTKRLSENKNKPNHVRRKMLLCLFIKTLQPNRLFQFE